MRLAWREWGAETSGEALQWRVDGRSAQIHVALDCGSAAGDAMLDQLEERRRQFTTETHLGA